MKLANTIAAVQLDAKNYEKFLGINYGQEDYQKEIDDWLRVEFKRAVKSGTKVWGYLVTEIDTGKPMLIGYGSVGKSKWPYPDKDSDREELMILPSLGICQELSGCPKNAQRDDRYSSQILRHLIDKAREMKGDRQMLGLYVHPRNAIAIKFYERHGFKTFHQTYNDGNTEYISYVLHL